MLQEVELGLQAARGNTQRGGGLRVIVSQVVLSMY